MNKISIAIIGAGNMGGSFYTGLNQSGNYALHIMDQNPASITKINAKPANQDDIWNADYILLAIKPQGLPELQVPANINPNTTIISMLAGTKIKTLEKYFKNNKVVRCMPNLPIKCQQGVIGWFGENIESAEKTIINNIFKCLGESIELESEDLVDRITLISGSGPGYIAYFQTLMTREAVKLGFDSDTAAMIAHSTFSGSVACLEKTDSQTLTEQVSSKGGVTEAIVETMQQNGFSENFHHALQAGLERMTELDKASHSNTKSHTTFLPQTNKFDLWNTQKQKTHQKSKIPYFEVGEIWWIEFGKNIGSESIGKGKTFLRPGLLLQKLYGKSALIVPLTTRLKKGSYYQTFTDKAGNLQTAILPQMKYVDGRRLSYKLSTVEPEQLEAIQNCISKIIKNNPRLQTGGPDKSGTK